MLTISITGPTGSCKTTLANHLAGILASLGHSARILHLDDFYLPNLDPSDYDTPSSIHWISLYSTLSFLTAGHPITMNNSTIPENLDFLIVEGLFPLNCAAVDYSIHISQPFDDCWARRVARGNCDPLITKAHVRRCTDRYIRPTPSEYTYVCNSTPFDPYLSALSFARRVLQAL